MRPTDRPVERVRGNPGGGVVRGTPVGDVGAARHADDARTGAGGHLQREEGEEEAVCRLAT